ncbi:DUF3302 domain-containing protein [Flammeovirga sp. MY04]|uniref:DUF3302 domain-containing protein n=1 Tax=Flammeovirga sp. MY04 TaxID=1191459 RepID=UPI0008064190|nr:DUF3302 domain-containing protein [Flammeovirga sp. MY04]ANQ50928.1 DUF3302 domain-containing protein [Flammeovirga sp. MY04]
MAMISPEKVNSFADIMAWVVVTVVPVIGAWIFWKIHIIPEEIAKKRNHPQADSIHMMCLLSLVMGGMLWPLALIWAYSNPLQFFQADEASFGEKNTKEEVKEVA